VMEADSRWQLLVLMHGDREVSTKQLARELGVKRVSPCDPISAEKYTGYKVGGISPFGIRKFLPVYVESSIMMLGRIFINGGRQGFMVEIDPGDLEKVFPVKKVNVSVRASAV
jgi:Cys-tRNA(Pro) deacylase